MIKDLNPGDIFCFKLHTGEYAFAQIILDIQSQCVDTKLIDESSVLLNPSKWADENEGVLINLFKEINKEPIIKNYEILKKGIIIDREEIEDGSCPIIDHKNVEITNIEFPECICNALGANGGTFQNGEIFEDVSFPTSLIAGYDLSPCILSTTALEHFVFYYNKRVVDVENWSNEWKGLRKDALDTRDIRFISSEIREQIFKSLGDDPNGSYYERALKRGFDLKRFYTES